MAPIYEVHRRGPGCIGKGRGCDSGPFRLCGPVATVLSINPWLERRRRPRYLPDPPHLTSRTITPARSERRIFFLKSLTFSLPPPERASSTTALGWSTSSTMQAERTPSPPQPRLPPQQLLYLTVDVALDKLKIILLTSLTEGIACIAGQHWHLALIVPIQKAVADLSELRLLAWPSAQALVPSHGHMKSLPTVSSLVGGVLRSRADAAWVEPRGWAGSTEDHDSLIGVGGWEPAWSQMGAHRGREIAN
ncbi:hypothetical protein K488DRAFT_75081 [Vararia minispora EC-137]|uniref:Uncharacterized protein n=1 Tax=Vararia minispora EC-137 TaxID=1314806 RepID=A0ACB8Q582_9AGAM|nr:hypothetical protein K488DRAFT_75081 [Vararia minispora EC-137]